MNNYSRIEQTGMTLERFEHLLDIRTQTVSGYIKEENDKNKGQMTKDILYVRNNIEKMKYLTHISKYLWIYTLPLPFVFLKLIIGVPLDADLLFGVLFLIPLYVTLSKRTENWLSDYDKRVQNIDRLCGYVVGFIDLAA